MSDRRQYSVHRITKAAYQGRHVRDALLRLAAQERRWPRATAPKGVVVTTHTIPADAPASDAGTEHKEP